MMFPFKNTSLDLLISYFQFRYDRSDFHGSYKVITVHPRRRRLVQPKFYKNIATRFDLDLKFVIKSFRYNKNKI